MRAMAEHEENFDSLKVDELKERCRSASLKVSGSKAELVERLKEHSSSKATESAQALTDPVAHEASPGTGDSDKPVAPVEASATSVASDELHAAASSSAAPAHEAAVPAEAKARDSSPAKSAKGSEASEGETGTAGKEEPAVEESIAARVARIWTAHASTDEKLVNADRLAVSAAYRQWVKTADLGLPEGTAVPPFTEVWMSLNVKSKAKLKPAAAADDEGDGKTGDRRSGDDDRRRVDDDREECGDFKRNRCRRGAQCKFSHNTAGRTWRQDRSRSRRRDARAPLSSVNNISCRNGDKALAGKDASGDPLADFAAEASKTYKKGEEEGNASDDEAKEGGSKDEGGGDKEGKEASAADRDKGAVGGALELERELDRRAAQREKGGGKKDGGSIGSRLDQPLTSSRDEKRRLGNVKPAESRKESLEKFDQALRQLCKDGLRKELPAVASTFNDQMRGMFKGWHIENTPFERFGNFLRAAEEEGLVKVKRERSQLLVTWIKYKYHVLPPRSPLRDADRRDRSRSAQPRAASACRGRAASARGARGRQGRAGNRDRGRGGRGCGRDRQPSRGCARNTGARVRSGSRRKPRACGARARSGSRGKARARRGDRDGGARGRKRRPPSSSPEYSYSYSDEYSYSASPSPPRGKRRSRSRRR